MKLRQWRAGKASSNFWLGVCRRQAAAFWRPGWNVRSRGRPLRCCTWHCGGGQLGLAFADDKRLPFGGRAGMLGVEVDLSNAARGTVVVDNKPQHQVEISEAIANIIARGSIPAKLPSILGRMQFADIQLSGKLGRLANQRYSFKCHGSRNYRRSSFRSKW